MKHSVRRPGFTIIELNIAIIFIAILLIAAALAIIATTKLYQQGVAIKTTNQIGRETIDVMRRDVASSSAKAIKTAEAGGVYRVCLGKVSYIIINAETLNSENPPTNLPKMPDSGALVHMARVNDTNSAWCEVDGSGQFIMNNLTATSDPVEMLQSDDINTLAVHAIDLTVLTDAASSDSEALVRLDMTLGTNEAGTVDGDNRCKPPTDREANFDNCAVREFSTTIRVTGVQ